jgi:class 3 adenylate cyclase
VTGPSTARTRGFLFADLRGYTAFVERHGDEAAVALLAAYRTLVREVVARHEGAEIRTEGDNFYVVFPSASAAVRCGLDILAAARDRVRDVGPALAIGIGVHAGETAESEQEGLVGSAVNIAARICSVAAPGELLVSDTVRALIRTSLQVRFVPRGTRRLKGVSEAVAVYRVEPAEAGVPRAVPPAGLARWRGVLPAGPLGAVLALAAAVLVLVAVPALYALRASQAPTPPAGGSASASAAGSPTPPAFPNADERALLERLPSAVTGGPAGPNCRESDAPDRATDATVSIVCTPASASAGAATIWYDVVADAGQLTNFFTGPELAGDCSKGTGFATTWQVPNPIPPNVPFLAGRLRCFQKASASWIWWTYDADKIVGRAVRNDTDWKALWEWWDVIGPALKEA